MYEVCACCGGGRTAQTDNFDELYGEDIYELAKAIYEQKTSTRYNPELLKTTANKLTSGVRSGWGDKISVDWNTPDHKMLSKLVQNTYQFSAAKNYQELQEIGGLIIGKDGNLREFSDFKEAVKKLNYKYNREWLEVEYDNAVSVATSSARWVDYQKNKDIMPMLRYQTMGDNSVRAEHRLLDKTTKPINDSFWKTYYPPNGWRCRCEAIQLPESNAPVVEPAGLPNVAPMFRTNLAQNGLIFPKGHPYFDGVPKDILRRSMQYIPQENAYIVRKEYEEHAMVQYEGEATENREIAKMLYKNGERDIRLMPRIEAHEQEVRKIIYGENYSNTHYSKCPDSFIGKEAAEFKRCNKEQKVKRIRKAALQADCAIIEITDILERGIIDTFANNRWADENCSNLKRIIVINNGKIYKYNRP